jgi:threonine dehydrogenase-like Zn-dependent dehydrogenase
MKGVFFAGDRTAVVREKADPTPGPGEVLVQMRAAAVCGSDLHRYRRPVADIGPFLDVVVGHEPCGVVADVGAGVTIVRPGDRVVVYHRRGCGKCDRCRTGNLGACPHRRSHGSHYDGGDGDYLVTDERNCLPLPDDFSFVEGAIMACNGGTAYEAVKKANPVGGQTLTVFGLGPVGLCTLLSARGMGARVIGVDISPERRQLARELGATEVVDGSAGDVPGRIRDLTDGRGTDTAVDTSGSPHAHRDLIAALGYRGRAAIVGFGNSSPSVNLCDIIDRQLTIQGSSIFPIGSFWEMCDFFRRQKIDLESVVTHRFSIADGPEAFSLADRAATGKIVFEWA